MTSFSNRNRFQDVNQTPNMNSSGGQQPPSDSQDLSKESFSENLKQYRESGLQEIRDQQRAMQSEMSQQQSDSHRSQEQSQSQQVQNQQQQESTQKQEQ